MINNFAAIRSLLSFPNPGDFYLCEILQRRKDNPGQAVDMRVIHYYVIESLDHFDSKIADIVTMCDAFNARAYFRLNRRNREKVALYAMRLMADNITTGQYNVRNVYWAACGRTHSDKDKKWIIDIDVRSTECVTQVIGAIEELRPTDIEKVVALLDTKNGYHIISRPFNYKEFKKVMPDVDVHKDNGTILYMP